MIPNPPAGTFASCLPSLDVLRLSDTLGRWRLWLFQLCLRSITTATIPGRLCGINAVTGEEPLHHGQEPRL